MSVAEISTGWPVGGGTMGTLTRDHDWTGTSLGPSDQWPIELRTVIDMALGATLPIGVLWGDDRVQFYNDPFMAMIGGRHPLLGLSFDDAWPELRSANVLVFARVAHGETVTVPDGFRPNGDDAETRFTISYSPLRDHHGDVAGLLMTVQAAARPQDAWSREARRSHNEGEQGEALKTANALWEGFAEASTDVLWISDPSGGTLDYLSPSFESVWGAPRESVMKDLSQFQQYVHPEDRGVLKDAVHAVLAEGSKVVEYRIVRPLTGEVRWIRDTGFVIPGVSPLRLGGIARDVTDKHRAKARQGRLTFELQHRVNDTLGLVRSLTRRTVDQGGPVEDMATHLIGRIDALARTEAALVDDPNVTVDLDTIVREELMAHGMRDGMEAEVGGDPIVLRPAVAQVMALAVHELATNAIKFGALSRSGGQLSVCWTLRNEGKPSLWFQWQETGVPLAVKPGASGFGTAFLKGGRLQGVATKVERELTADGLRCVIEVPLERPLAFQDERPA